MNWKTTRKVIGWSALGLYTVWWIFSVFRESIQKLGVGDGVATALFVVFAVVLLVVLFNYLTHD